MTANSAWLLDAAVIGRTTPYYLDLPDTNGLVRLYKMHLAKQKEMSGTRWTLTDKDIFKIASASCNKRLAGNLNLTYSCTWNCHKVLQFSGREVKKVIDEANRRAMSKIIYSQAFLRTKLSATTTEYTVTDAKKKGAIKMTYEEIQADPTSKITREVPTLKMFLEAVDRTYPSVTAEDMYMYEEKRIAFNGS